MESLNLFSYYFFGALNLYFASVLTQSKEFPRKRKAVIFIFIVLLIGFTAPVFRQAVTLLALLGLLFLFSYKMSQKLSNLISFLAGYLVLVCMDNIFAWLWYLSFGITVSEVQREYLLPHSLLFLPILFLAEKGVQWILHTRFQIENISPGNAFLRGILGNLIVSALIFAVLIIFGERVGYPPEVIALNGFLFFAVFLLSSALLTGILWQEKKERELSMQLMQYENLSSYTHKVEQLYQSMRSFRHDYIDILSAMKLYIDEKNTEKLSEYFYETILPMGKEMTGDDKQLGKLAFIQNDTVKSLLFSKILLASDKNIHVEVEIREYIAGFPIKELDLLRVLGIFLNNAVEAAQEAEEKALTIAIFSDHQGITILIQNTAKELSLPLGRLCERDISSKEAHSGIGLYTAKAILDSYRNISWNYSWKPPYFQVELFLEQEGEEDDSDLRM